VTRRDQPIPPIPPQGNIKFLGTFEEMRIAKEWNLTPREWYDEPRWSRATMVAASRYERRVEHWMYEDNK
jgi:hypothetical protein